MIVLLLVAVLALAASAFLAAAAAGLLGEPALDPGALPGVSILKPIKGVDAELADNLASFYRLDYPEYEVVFSFASRSDAAVEIARRAADAHPHVPTTFVFDSREPGANPKVSRLMHAAQRARYPLLLVSDADVRVRPDFLRETVAELSDPAAGLVSNPFRGIGRRSFGSRLETLHFNTFVFGGTAAVSRLCRRPCVVGKSILIRRSALAWIGGFEAVKDFLAEDYLLGDLVKRAGFRVVLSRHVVDARSSGRTVRQFLDRQVRWARMRRRLGGIAFASELLASPVPFAAVLLGTRFALAGAALIAAKAAIDSALLTRLGLPVRARDLFAIVVKDVLFFGVFWAAIASTTTRWRGKTVSLGYRTLVLEA